MQTNVWFTLLTVTEKFLQIYKVRITFFYASIINTSGSNKLLNLLQINVFITYSH